jgi:hypothetical protein
VSYRRGVSRITVLLECSADTADSFEAMNKAEILFTAGGGRIWL